MLVQFKVGNFLSFNETQTFSMQAGKFRNYSDRLYKENGHKLLKFMSVYGANASGKSNLIAAFGFFQTFVINGFRSGAYPLYCKVKEENKEQKSHFEIKVKLDNKIFIYGFDAILNTASFANEFLYEELKNGNIKTVFERNIVEGKFKIGNFFNSSTTADRLKIYGEDIKNDDSVLFLKIMNQNKDSLYSKNIKLKVFKDLYLWIKYKLDVNSPESTITNYSLLHDSNNLQLIADKLNAFSTGIVKFNIVDVPPEKAASTLPKDVLNDIQQRLSEQESNNEKNNNYQKSAVLIRTPNNLLILELTDDGIINFKTLEFKHNHSDAIFSLEDESDGTARLLDIIEVLLNQDEEKVYIIDEINRTFHPLLTVKFVKEFLELAKTRNTQLIVTTHESQLMNLDLLRKDEINFIDKNEFGYSYIYSLDKFNDRFDKKVVKEYFKGKYDAIPSFGYNIKSNTES